MARPKPVPASKSDLPVWNFGEKCSCGKKVKILTRGDKELAWKCDHCGWLVGSMAVVGSNVTIDNTGK